MKETTAMMDELAATMDDEVKAIIRRYEAMKYLLACEASRRGGELLIESDCTENFTNVGFHLDNDENGLRLKIVIGEQEQQTH